MELNPEIVEFYESKKILVKVSTYNRPSCNLSLMAYRSTRGERLRFLTKVCGIL